MLDSKAFRATIWLLLIFLLVWVGQHITFIFRPIVVLITTIFFPVLVAGIFFYLTKPVVTQLTAWRIPRTAAILLIFVSFATAAFIAVLYLVPILQQQLSSLIGNIPSLLRELDRQVADFQDSSIFSRFEQFEFFRRWSNIDYISVIDSIVDGIIQNTASVIGSITNVAVVLFTVPFFLFYMLKDGHQISDFISQMLPTKYREKGEEVLKEMSATLSAYIQGILLVSLFVGITAYIGYRIIGLDYALLLSVVLGFTNIIPYFGPLIGTTPGVIVGLIASPFTALQVLIMMVIIQQLENQLVAPQVIGRKLRIHPVTIIVIMLTAGSLAGFLGIILAIPTYAVMKVVVTAIYRMAKASS